MRRRAFYLVLVRQLLDILVQEGRGHAEFAEQLRSLWPELSMAV